MELKKIKEVVYEYGDEEKIISLLYHSKEPILIKIKNFTDKFSLDYFEKNIQAMTTYTTFNDNKYVDHKAGNFTQVISEIKQNKPHRIFCQILYANQSAEIEQHIPLWQKIPFRPRYFNKLTKVAYFFGGKGSNTGMHFDRELGCNLHLCLSGKKELLLFTEDQNQYLYKFPFVGDTLIDFTEPMDKLKKQYPRINQAGGYKVIIERGDMVFMPKNCWHYTKYLDAASSATYAFYPKKMLQIFGYFTGKFYLGYMRKEASGFGICNWPPLKQFSRNYALASGPKKFFYTLIERIILIFLLPIVSIITIIDHKLHPRKLC